MLVLVIATAAVSAAGFWRYRQLKPKGREITVQRNLTADQQKIYKDRIAQAEKFLQNLKPADKDYASTEANTRMYLGQQYYGLGQLTRAEEIFRQAYGYDKANYNILTDLAMCQIEEKNFPAAEETLKQAAETAGNVPDVWLRYVGLVKDQSPMDYEKIDGIYRQALSITDRQTDVLVSYAGYLEQKGDTVAARDAWKEAASSTGQNSDYLNEYRRLGGK